MGSPYLNSGETIVLTTNRVVVDAIAYDVMLTSARIFFIDNMNPRFEPGESPLSAILSVQGGKTPANDPVITIVFRPEEGGEDVRQPLNLVFSQNPGENRKPERDEWVRTIIQASVALQERRIAAEMPPVPETAGERGLQPAVRRWVAPDRVRPLSNVGHPQSAVPATTVVMPDEVEGGGEIPVSATETRAKIGDATEPDKDPGPGPDSGTAAGNPPVPNQRELTVIRARIIKPQITEELLPGQASPMPLAVDEPAGGNEYDLKHTAQDLVPRPDAAGKPAPELSQETEIITLSEPAVVPDTPPAESLPDDAPVTAISEAPLAELSLPEFPYAEDAVHPEETPASAEPAEEANEILVTVAIPEAEQDIGEPEISPADTIDKPSGPEFPTRAGDAVHPEETPASTEPEGENEIPVTIAIPEAVPGSAGPEISPSGEVIKPAGTADLESAVPELIPSPASGGSPDSCPDTAPQTASASINIPHEHAEAQQEERPAPDSPGISGSDAGIPEEDIGQESAAPPVTDPLLNEMSGISEPATPAAVGNVFAEPPVSSSPEISRTSAQEAPGPAVERSSGDVAPPQDASPSPESGAAGIPPAGHPVPPAQQHPPGRTLTYAAVLLLIIALVATGVMLLLPQGLQGNPAISPAVTVPVPGTPDIVNPATPTVPSVKSPPASSVTPLNVPKDGVWAEVNSTADYLGRVGNPEQMRQFSGSGVNFYKIPRSDKAVQVSVQKQDNSGARLTVGIYRNGTLISTRSVTMPMGTIDLLIDPITARAPGLAENDTSSGGHAVGRIENY